MMEVQLVRQKYTTTTTTTRELHKKRTTERRTWQKERPKTVSREVIKEKTRATIQKTQKTVTSNNTRSRMIEKTNSKREKTLLQQKGNLYSNVAELQKIIRQSSKERLQLERHLARSTTAINCNSRIDVSQYEALRRNNENLRQRLEDLLRTAGHLQDAEIRLQKRDLEIQQLKQELGDKLLLCAELEQKLNLTLNVQDRVEKHSKDLETLLQHIDPVDEECSKLISCCDILSSHFTLAKGDSELHHNQVNNLETLVKHMREAAEKRKEYEKQYADAVAELQKKQDEIRYHSSMRTEKHVQESIQSLESKIRELQKKCELQNVLHEELSLEMTSLRKSQAKQAWRSNRSHSAEGPTETNKMDQDMDLYLVGSDTIFSSNRSHAPSALDNTPRGLNVSFEPYGVNPLTSPGMNMISPGTTVSSSSPVSSHILNSASYEIDKIIARIEQDNKILAELERSRATVGSPVSSANIERLKAQFEEDQKQSDDTIHRSNMKSSLTSKDLEGLMAKLEQDNRILAELDRKRANISSRRPFSTTPPSSHCGTPLSSSLTCQMGNTSQCSMLPTLPSTAPYGTNQKSGEMYDELDYIDLPHRGRCKVYIARFSYDPLKQSPNENPEAELRLIAGDYVLIFGEMDEDGFFSGELLDGRKGLVPSNFVEKLTGMQTANLK